MLFINEVTNAEIYIAAPELYNWKYIIYTKCDLPKTFVDFVSPRKGSQA